MSGIEQALVGGALVIIFIWLVILSLETGDLTNDINFVEERSTRNQMKLNKLLEYLKLQVKYPNYEITKIPPPEAKPKKPCADCSNCSCRRG